MNSKKIFIYLFALLSSTLLIGQNQTYISGKVTNAKAGEEVKVQIDRWYVGDEREEHTAQLKNGQYTIAFDLTDNRFIDVSFKGPKVPFYIEPGDSLVINFDGKTFPKNVELTGEDAIHNDFLTAFNEEFKEWTNESMFEEKVLAENTDQFEMSLFDARLKQKKFIKKHEKKDQLSKSFLEFMDRHIKYRYLNGITSYPIVRANSNAASKSVQRLPSIIEEDIKKTSINDDKAMIDPIYRSFIDYYIIYFTSEANKFQKFTDYSKSVDAKFGFARQILEGQPLQYFLAKYLLEFCDQVKPSTSKRLFNLLEYEETDSVYTKMVLAKCEEAMNAPEEEEDLTAGLNEDGTGSGKYPFSLTNLDGEATNLEDFKGKVVYIDFWASWCGPCRKQFPHAKKIKETLKAELSSDDFAKVEFLYISIDDSKGAWKKSIEKLGIEGTHVISPGGWNSKVASFFQIRGIPRYMLMNKEGQIVNPNAPRPSSEDTVGAILRLIRE